MTNTPLWTSVEIIDAVAGKCENANWYANGVSIDSRSVENEDLFIAIIGPENDGHDYVQMALDNGASAALVSKLPDDCKDTSRLIFVEDTQTGMEQLGAAARARSSAKIIAVTGSVGKTGTKEALAHVLSAQGKTHYSIGSFNNHWGVPLSLSRMSRDAEYGIFELGMNHAGELGPLSKMVRPHVAIITTVAVAHLEFFKNTTEIAEAKAEVFEGLEEKGVALINVDNEHGALLLQRAQNLNIETIIGFGKEENADVRLEEILLMPHSSEISAKINDHKYRFTLAVPGEHWAMNIMAVLGAVDSIGADVAAATKALSTMVPPSGRGVLVTAHCPTGDFTIIDESYNASPIAMQAAFSVLKRKKTENQGRKIAVLGDMRELGEKSAEIHKSLAIDLSDDGVDMVYACGPNMRHLFDALPADKKSGYASNSEELAGMLVVAVQSDDIVLIKGSLGSKMKLILEALLAVASERKPANSAGV